MTRHARPRYSKLRDEVRDHVDDCRAGGWTRQKRGLLPGGRAGRLAVRLGRGAANVQSREIHAVDLAKVIEGAAETVALPPPDVVPDWAETGSWIRRTPRSWRGSAGRGKSGCHRLRGRDLTVWRLGRGATCGNLRWAGQELSRQKIRRRCLSVRTSLPPDGIRKTLSMASFENPINTRVELSLIPHTEIS
jgi:hypothetical protein